MTRKEYRAMMRKKHGPDWKKHDTSWKAGMSRKRKKPTREEAARREAYAKRIRAKAAESARAAEKLAKWHRDKKAWEDMRRDHDAMDGGIWKSWPNNIGSRPGYVGYSSDGVFYKQLVAGQDGIAYGYEDSDPAGGDHSECYFILRGPTGRYSIHPRDLRLSYAEGLTKTQAVKWLRDEVAGKNKHTTYDCYNSWDDDDAPYSPAAEERFARYVANPRKRRNRRRGRR